MLIEIDDRIGSDQPQPSRIFLLLLTEGFVILPSDRTLHDAGSVVSDCLANRIPDGAELEPTKAMG